MNSSKKFNLIVPAAADKPEYAGAIPFVFTLNKEGVLHCVKAILGLKPERFDEIYFTILKKHAVAYDVDALLKLQIRRLGLKNVYIVILDEPTVTQAETIEKTIQAENIEGSIFIKDADGYFEADIYPENGVAVFPLEKLSLVDPRNKSYVSVDDMHHITNIIEKRVVSHFFNAGGYCFENVGDFLNAYYKHKELGAVYISHLIYSMLLDHYTFRPITVSNYLDWNIK